MGIYTHKENYRGRYLKSFFFVNDTATTEIYTLSLHDALPIFAMADLRRVLGSLGYTDVSTHLRSGNAIISSDDEDPERIAATIHEALAAELSLRSGVIVRTGKELAAVIAANPFPEHESEPAKLHVAFLSAQPSKAAFEAIDPARFAPDEFRLGDRAMYLWFPNGAGRSKLTMPALARMK